jgi:asparagine synthase (glutamine-hydrolysing)
MLQSFDLVPRVRFAEKRGVEALVSDYQYLDALAPHERAQLRDTRMDSWIAVAGHFGGHRSVRWRGRVAAADRRGNDRRPRSREAPYVCATKWAATRTVSPSRISTWIVWRCGLASQVEVSAPIEVRTGWRLSMCGFAAEFSYAKGAPPISASRLQKASAAMTVRGPDGAGEWISADGCVGLVHRRLAILDLSESGAQPMVTSDGSTRIVFNGEIYNFRELRAQLERKGYRFRSQSDTEVLLHLYQECGREMVRQLRGMFAFALWDARTRGILLARDPFGIKPLYYVDDGTCVRAASQVKALVAAGDIDTSASAAAHVGFFVWGHVPEPWTLYKGIRALPAGTTLWIEQHGRKAEPKTYFDLTAELQAIEAQPVTLRSSDVEDRLRAAMTDTVAHHMIADVPVGVFLSSGLDSTSIAALAAEHTQEAMRTVTLGFAEYMSSPNDEVPLAEAFARQFGFNHATRYVQRGAFEADWDKLMVAMDGPSIDGVNGYFVSKAAHELGLKVALSGLGGDELFGGYPSFQQIPRLVRYIKPFAFLGRGFRWVSGALLRQFTSPKYASLFEYGGTYGGAYLLRRGLCLPWQLPQFLDADLVREGWRELSSLNLLAATTAGIASGRLRVSALETAWYMRNQLLRDTDWASMAHSLEVRVPLVDIDLWREVMKLVAAGHLVGKADMARCPRHQLPAAILGRTKTGFSVPVREWLRGHGYGETRGLLGWAKMVYCAAWSA